MIQQTRFTRTVPRHLVHRAAVAEVLVTGYRLAAADCRIDAQWPRDHVFYQPVCDRWHDPLLVLETVRQASMVAAFEQFGADPDAVFVVHELRLTAVPDALLIGPRPADVTLQIRGVDVVRRGGTLRSMGTRVDLYRDGVPAGHGYARFSCLTALAHRRLRGTPAPQGTTAIAPPVDPASVGRTRKRDVLLAHSGQPGVWLLRPDLAQPTLFDHPLDHVPGMALVEAARQTARLVRGAPVLPVEIASRFDAYVDLAGGCTVHVDTPNLDPAAAVVVMFEQHGRPAAHVSIRTVLT